MQPQSDSSPVKPPLSFMYCKINSFLRASGRHCKQNPTIGGSAAGTQKESTVGGLERGGRKRTWDPLNAINHTKSEEIRVLNHATFFVSRQPQVWDTKDQRGCILGQEVFCLGSERLPPLGFSHFRSEVWHRTF